MCRILSGQRGPQGARHLVSRDGRGVEHGQLADIAQKRAIVSASRPYRPGLRYDAEDRDGSTAG
jgi:hypothetical protein